MQAVKAKFNHDKHGIRVCCSDCFSKSASNEKTQHYEKKNRVNEIPPKVHHRHTKPDAKETEMNNIKTLNN